jgi:hypothetical protein
MKEKASGLVRYRGRLMSPTMARLIKGSTHHNKARKYAPKGIDPGTISPCLADVQRLGPGILSPEARDIHDRVTALAEQLMRATDAQAEF